MELASSFKSVAVTGPHQTGKTTLVKYLFKDKPYVSFENPDFRNFALEDPRRFLQTYSNGAVLDEIQRVPDLFSYLQELLDNSSQKGLFVFSGSNNYLLQQNISQSLAGRVAFMNLLPFSLSELNFGHYLPSFDDELMLKGFYPPIYDQNIPSTDWCANYISTYIEKDVRQIKNIFDLHTFEKLLSLLAGRVGQELNLSSLSVELGVDIKTIKSWIGILESSFIIYLLKPHYINFNKTLIKRPKLYFHDTSLVCYLLKIYSSNQLAINAYRGSIFENMVISELLKHYTNLAIPSQLYYWRDKSGLEIDLILDNGTEQIPIEIKSGQTITSEYFKNSSRFIKISGAKRAIILYGGKETQLRNESIQIMPWRNFSI